MRILIVEDEEAAVSRLRKLLAGIGAEIEVAGAVPSISAAVKWIGENPAPERRRAVAR